MWVYVCSSPRIAREPSSWFSLVEIDLIPMEYVHRNESKLVALHLGIALFCSRFAAASNGCRLAGWDGKSWEVYGRWLSDKIEWFWWLSFERDAFSWLHFSPRSTNPSPKAKQTTILDRSKSLQSPSQAFLETSFSNIHSLYGSLWSC